MQTRITDRAEAEENHKGNERKEILEGNGLCGQDNQDHRQFFPWKRSAFYRCFLMRQQTERVQGIRAFDRHIGVTSK